MRFSGKSGWRLSQKEYKRPPGRSAVSDFQSPFGPCNKRASSIHSCLLDLDIELAGNSSNTHTYRLPLIPETNQLDVDELRLASRRMRRKRDIARSLSL